VAEMAVNPGDTMVEFGDEIEEDRIQSPAEAVGQATE